jgi:hypothetical protein
LEVATQINEEIEPELARLLVRPKLSPDGLPGMGSEPAMLPETHSFVRLHQLPSATASKVSLRFSFQGARETYRLDDWGANLSLVRSLGQLLFE